MKEQPTDPHELIVLADYFTHQREVQATLGDRLGKHVKVLSPRQTDVVNMRAAGMTFADIGQVLEIKASTAKTTFADAKTKLLRSMRSDPLLKELFDD